ncbi:MAG: GAF domain-containing protein [Candidatus Theseobacter exili]|nr:GAF domain-containing protein [Candidatus Theseobacter exili]
MDPSGYKHLLNECKDFNFAAVALAKKIQVDFNCERVTIFLKSRDGRFVSIVAQGVEGMSIDVKPGEGIAGKVISERHSIISNDPQYDTRSLCRIRDNYTGYSSESLLAVPVLNIFKRPVGALMLLNSLRGSFLKKDSDALQKLAVYIRQLRRIAPADIENIWSLELESEI